jgi:hypothetical protein
MVVVVDNEDRENGLRERGIVPRIARRGVNSA